MLSRGPLSVLHALAGKRAIVAGLLPPRIDAANEMAHLASCARQLGATVVGTIVQRRGTSRTGRPGGARAAHLGRPLQHSTYIGSGKVRELQDLCESSKAEVVIFYNPLSTSQRRTLEKITGLPVFDRLSLMTSEQKEAG